MSKSLHPLHQAPPVTSESIIAAKLYQLQQRALVTQETGHVFPCEPGFIADELAEWELGLNYARLAGVK